MSAASLRLWQTDRSVALQEIQAAHASVGGVGPGRRYATQQINQAYVMLLSGQFQGFCRDLHTECVDVLAGLVPDPAIKALFLAEARRGRMLDKGNPSPANVGSDFNRLGVRFWDEIRLLHPKNAERQRQLELLNTWRNAIAHQDFRPSNLDGQSVVRLQEVRQWHRACDFLAWSCDTVMETHLRSFLGSSPW